MLVRVSITPGGRARQTSLPFVPDLELYINLLDEPSVLLGTQAGRYHEDEYKTPEQPMWTDFSHHSIATAVSEAYQVRGNEAPLMTTSPLEEIVLSSSSVPSGKEFVWNSKAQKNLCQNPELASQHGFVMCPATLRRLSF
ncbi:hypothetical protein PspLS_07770 [Pyricularia sp. CBS 133598]|nr:hypothetical protein PspLS_07770 [Pyricularia sp. CBS 133598]